MKDSKLNIVIIVQARMGSTRLPNKIILPLSNKPLLGRMMERVTVSKTANDYMVATTSSVEDDKIAELCVSENIKCFRGHPTDLLDRHYKAGLELNADVVVKIPSDCPMIDPEIIDKVIYYYTNNKDNFDFVSNLHPATYPDGNDVEVIPMKILKIAWREAKSSLEREHTTPLIWENPQRFRIGNVEWETGLDYSMSHRFTIDYHEDYEFIKCIYDNLYEKNPMFRLNDILKLLDEKPELMEINKKYAGVNWYRNHLDELKTITKEQTRLI